jgi:hypothetical protein
MYPIGTIVDGAHGEGIIIGYNGRQESSAVQYAMTRRGLDALDQLPAVMQSITVAGLTAGFYNAKDYPYIVLFADNYKDVYATRELEVLDKPCASLEQIEQRLLEYETFKKAPGEPL